MSIAFPVNIPNNFARQMGVEVRRGDPRGSKPGVSVVIPEHPRQMAVVDVDLDRVRRSYLRRAAESLTEGERLTDADLNYLVAETRSSRVYVEETINDVRAKTR